MIAVRATEVGDPLTLRAPHGAINTSRVVRKHGYIARLRALSHDTVELVVACPPDSPPLPAQAGQFATLAVADIDAPRPYSFARDPRLEAPGEHTFFIRRVPGGAMSAWLAAGDRTGTEVEITGPLGSFVLDTSAAPMLVVAGGSGLSAVKALVEAAARRGLRRDCLFLYGARTRADTYASRELAAVVHAWHPDHRFELVEVLSEEADDSDWRGARGLVTDYLEAHVLAAGVLAPGSFRAWLCGPPPMIEAAMAVLDRAGVPALHVYRDVFADLRSPAPVIDNRRCVLCDECLVVKPVPHCIIETTTMDPRAAVFSNPLTRVSPGQSAGLYYGALVIDPAACIRCYACIGACPHGAISPDFDPRTHTLRHAVSGAEVRPPAA